MSVIARWCHRHRIVIMLVWLALLACLGALSGAVGSKFDDTLSFPASESSHALALLKAAMPAASGDSDTVVWHVRHGSVTDGRVQDRMKGVLAGIARSHGVASVTSPYGPQGSAQVSRDGRTAYAQVIFTRPVASVAKTDVKRVIALADRGRVGGVDVQLGGAAVEATDREVGSASETVGVLAALVVMGLVFRSAWAAVLPVVTAVAGVTSGVIGIGLIGHLVSIASPAPTLGALVGLGVGIDYALFIVNRHRKGLLSGMPVAESVTRALDTSGRAVLFAGLTVIVALLGMFALGLGFLDGMALGAALTVAMTVLAAITLLPALLGTLGPRVLSRSQRRRLRASEETAARPATTAYPMVAYNQLAMPDRAPDRQGVWMRWARSVQARPVGKAMVAVAVMALVAVPVCSLRLGTSDAGNDPAPSTTRHAYDLLARGFGPGFNGPLMLVAKVPTERDREALARLVDELGKQRGVARVTAMPVREGQSVAPVSVVPTTSPESARTSELIDRLRHRVIPRSGVRVLVGGTTAMSDDFDHELVSKLPMFVAIVVGLGCLLMVLAFRSLLVPLLGVAMNLLTMGAAFGAIVAVFQWGWGADALGAGAAGPVEAFIPVMVIAILFGLSMDYQVFLISRMHEEWTHTLDNRRAVRVGQGETGQVIAAAAVIMFCVFAAFVFGGQRMIAEFGVGLALAVLLDVLLLRMVLVPALMHGFGRANWWFPRWLDVIMPDLSVEGRLKPAPFPEPSSVRVLQDVGR